MALFFGYVQGAFAAWTGYCFAFIVWWDFEFQPAQAGQEDELVYPSHNIAYLAHLSFKAFFLFSFYAGFSQGDVLFGQSGRGDYRFGFCYGAERFRVVFERCAVSHVAQNFYPFRNRRVGAGKVG